MRSQTVIVSLFATGLLYCVNLPLWSAEQPMGDETIKLILRERIAAIGPGVGMVVGIIDTNGTRIISEGKMSEGESRPVDGDTVFEIGSVTKVFTALALADMVQHGEVKLDDPIAAFLPANVEAPDYNGHQITLLDLVTHTSGLPPLPANLMPGNPANPYADYTEFQLYDFLSHYKLSRDIGGKFEYSNLGAALLGHLLARKSGTDYEVMVRARICAPLGMADTWVSLPPELRSRLAQGHNKSGQPAANWTQPVFAGAGAICSTANDLLKFLAANLGVVKTPLAPAMDLARQPRRDANSPEMKIGLGWFISRANAGDIVWHNGATGGYHAFVGFVPSRGRGVVVLANTAASIDDLALHLLEPTPEPASVQPVSRHTAIRLAPEMLDECVGRYQLTSNIFLSVKRDREQMFVQMTGQSYLEMFPESEGQFFLKAVDAQLTFVKNEKGETTALILHQNGRDRHAEKMK